MENRRIGQMLRERVELEYIEGGKGSDRKRGQSQRDRVDLEGEGRGGVRRQQSRQWQSVEIEEEGTVKGYFTGGKRIQSSTSMLRPTKQLNCVQCHSPPAAVLPPCPPLLPLHNPLPSPFPRFALLHANCKSCGYSRCQIFDLPVNSLNAGYLSSSHLRQVHIPHTPLNLLIAQAAVRRLSFALLLFAPLSPCAVFAVRRLLHIKHTSAVHILFVIDFKMCNEQT